MYASIEARHAKERNNERKESKRERERETHRERRKGFGRKTEKTKEQT
jgi:hypothetical protein